MLSISLVKCSFLFPSFVMDFKRKNDKGDLFDDLKASCNTPQPKLYITALSIAPLSVLTTHAPYPLYVYCIAVSMVTGCNKFPLSNTITSIMLHTQPKTFSVGCCGCLHPCSKSPLVILTWCNLFMFPTWSSFSVSQISCILHLVLRRSGVPCIHHSCWSLSGSSCHLDLSCMSDAYPQGLPMQASTSCQDTGRRT